MDKKTKWLTGLFAGVSMCLFTTLSIWLFGDANSFWDALPISTIGGFVAALLFVWLMGRMSKKINEDMSEVLESSEGEFKDDQQIIRQTNATHFKGIEGVGGVLILTPKRLVFQSHGFNISNHQWEVALADITYFSRRKTLGIIPNGLEITTKEGSKPERFVVIGAGDWENELKQCLAVLQ